MAEYRALAVGDDGHIGKSTPLICNYHREEVEKTGEVVEGHVIEVWSGDRFVTRLVTEREKTVNELQRRARNALARFSRLR